MLFRIRMAMVCLLGLMASSSYGVFDAQLLVGQRSAKVQPDDQPSSNISGQVVKLAGHIDPIPLVPVAFGLTAAQVTYKEDTDDFGFDSFKGTEIGAEVMAWLPTGFLGITPYGKIGYTFLGAYAYENGTADAVFQPTGLNFGVGLKYSPLPLVGILLEWNNGMADLKAKEVKINGEKVPKDDSDIDSTTTDLLIGVQVGL
jgi:hypothetical protein